MLSSLNSRLVYLDDEYCLIHVCCSRVYWVILEICLSDIYYICFIISYGYLCENKLIHVWFSYESGSLLLALIVNVCHIFVYSCITLSITLYFLFILFWCMDESDMIDERFYFALMLWFYFFQWLNWPMISSLFSWCIFVIIHLI